MDIAESETVTPDLEVMDRLYFGTYQGGLLIYDNGVISRIGKAQGLKPSNGGVISVYGIGQNPNNPDHLVLGMMDNYKYSTSSGIYESFDHGETWRHVPGLGGSGDVWKVRWHPSKPLVYFGTSNGMFVYEYEKNDMVVKENFLEQAETLNSYALPYLTEFWNAGYFNHMKESSLNIEETMTTIDFITLLNKVLELKQTSWEQTFSNIPLTNKYYSKLQIAVDNGIIEPAKEFDLSHVVTNQELLQMIQHAIELLQPNISDTLTCYEAFGIPYDAISQSLEQEATKEDLIATIYVAYALKNAPLVDSEIPLESKEMTLTHAVPVEPETVVEETPIITTNEIKNTFHPLLGNVTSSKTMNSISWNKIKNADGYEIYGKKVSEKGLEKRLKIIKSNNTTTFKHKKCSMNTYYQYYVVAYQLIDEKRVPIYKSSILYTTTTSKKYGNATAIKIGRASCRERVSSPV